jgi:tetratricopeptide (TPR) repeat protein
MNVQRRAATGRLRPLVAAAAFLLALSAFCPAGAADQAGVWEPWKSETVSLDPRGSAQVRVVFADMPVRAWRLVVDGGDQTVDVVVVRGLDEALLYASNDESRHVVDIPWGRGEEAIIVLTNREHAASFAITLYGPPRDQVQAAYSFGVNRALEAYAGGRRLEAEDQCRRALDADPRDAEAMVLLAGFKRDRGFYDQAAELVDTALGQELTPQMQALAEGMRDELVALRAPLPDVLRDGILAAEQHLEAGRPDEALELADGLLAGDVELTAPARSRLLMIRGRALRDKGRNFEALDAFTSALHFARSRAAQGVIYVHMGRLYTAMENWQQAQGAYTIALQSGLPSGLDLQARDELKEIERVLGRQR